MEETKTLQELIVELINQYFENLTDLKFVEHFDRNRPAARRGANPPPFSRTDYIRNTVLRLFPDGSLPTEKSVSIENLPEPLANQIIELSSNYNVAVLMTDPYQSIRDLAKYGRHN